MNPWHLVWIIPLSASVGCVISALLIAAGQGDEYNGYDSYDC